MLYTRLFIIVMVMLNTTSFFAAELRSDLFVKADPDGYVGPRAAWPNKDQYCRCETLSYPAGKKLTLSRQGIGVELAFTPTEEVLSRRYLGTTQGVVGRYEDQSRRYVDHYAFKTVERGWLRDTFRSYDHIHEQMFAEDSQPTPRHFVQPQAQGRWTRSIGRPGVAYGPMQARVESRQWSQNTRLANILLIGGGTGLSLAYLRYYKSVNARLKKIVDTIFSEPQEPKIVNVDNIRIVRDDNSYHHTGILDPDGPEEAIWNKDSN